MRFVKRIGQAEDRHQFGDDQPDWFPDADKLQAIVIGDIVFVIPCDIGDNQHFFGGHAIEVDVF